MSKKCYIFGLLFLLIAAACTSSGEGDPAQTVEAWLQAKIEGSPEALQPLLCSQLEATLQQEAATFNTVSEVQLANVSCQFDTESSIVHCDGSIEATYGLESTSFPLGSYSVVQENGVWKWCGEAG